MQCRVAEISGFLIDRSWTLPLCDWLPQRDVRLPQPTAKLVSARFAAASCDLFCAPSVAKTSAAKTDRPLPYRGQGAIMGQ